MSVHLKDMYTGSSFSDPYKAPYLSNCLNICFISRSIYKTLMEIQQFDLVTEVFCCSIYCEDCLSVVI